MAVKNFEGYLFKAVMGEYFIKKAEGLWQPLPMKIATLTATYTPYVAPKPKVKKYRAYWYGEKSIPTLSKRYYADIEEFNNAPYDGTRHLIELIETDWRME